MSTAEIISYGMKPVALCSISNNVFHIEITDVGLAQEERCIYAFVVDDQIVRVGSSKARLKTRLGDWHRDVSAALQGRNSRTPQHEAEGWREILPQSKQGVIYARPGTIVSTPIGEISAYLDEEITLIARHRPRFCRR